MVRLTVSIDVLEKHAVLQSTSRIEELVKIFVHAARVCIRCYSKDLQRAYVSCRWRPVSGTWGMVNALGIIKSRSGFILSRPWVGNNSMLPQTFYSARIPGR